MSTASITTHTRMLIQDTGQPFIATAIGDGQTTIFDLDQESISSASPLAVTVNSTTMTLGTDFTIAYKYGVIEFTSAPASQSQIVVVGTYYDYWDDDEVTQAVTDGFNLHVNDQNPLPVIDPSSGQTGIPNVEEYMVAILAAIELLWFRATDSASTIDIHTPEGVTIPRSERYSQLTQHIANLQEEYKSMCGALGIGLWRIQVLWQRRVSYTTNRLVPLYEEQEYNTPYTGFTPTVAPVGAIVTINGQYFTGATSVTFGGVPAGFDVVSDTEIQATVPAGAITGQIGVVTPYGTVLSTAQFVVGQPAPVILYGPEIVTPAIPPGT
jgi:hypothetical protein